MDETFKIVMWVAIAVTVVLSIILAAMVFPKKRRENSKGFLKFLQDVFNFKWLALEKIFKFLYLLSTIACIVVGLTFAIYSLTLEYVTLKSVLSGLVVAVVGPIATRFAYEMLLLSFLLVRNVMDIKKIVSCKGEKIPCEKVEQEEEEEFDIFESTLPDLSGFSIPDLPPPVRVCETCGKENKPENQVCTGCGSIL